MRKGGDRRKPIWLTEITWPASKGRVDKPRPAWQRAWETTDAGVARRLSTFYELAVRARRRMGLGRVYWYTWSSAFRESDLFDYSGLVRWRQDAYDGPAGAAGLRAKRPPALELAQVDGRHLPLIEDVVPYGRRAGDLPSAGSAERGLVADRAS